MSRLPIQVQSHPISASMLDPLKPFFGKALMDPETAEAWLERYNVGNRWRRTKFVEHLAHQIKGAEWQSNHPQPIVFSNIRLIDGQHRLAAVAVAGIPVIVNLVCGTDDRLREYIDTGISRKLADRVTFDDDLIVNRNISQIVSVVFQITKGRSIRPTPNEAADTFTAQERGIRFAADRMRKNQRGITRAAVMAAVAEYHQREPEKAVEFTDGLLAPTSDVQQASYLRDWLLRNAVVGSGGQQNTLDTYGRSVSAMRHHRDARKISSLRTARWE